MSRKIQSLETMMDVGLTVVTYVLFLSTITHKVSSAVIKTIPEDQEYAEHYFLHPEEKSVEPKTCLRKDLRNMTNVCHIESAVFMEICKEVVEVESIRTLYRMFYLDSNQIAEPCQNCTVKLYRTKTKETGHRVEARQCPIIIGGHPLWVSKGYEEGSIFVFYENYISDEKLRVEDYIVFLDTAGEPDI